MKPSQRAYDARYECFIGFLGAGLRASAEGGLTETEAGAAQRSTSGDVAFEPLAWPRQAFPL